MSNHHLRESRLSLKAKGLLSLMLSLPDDWEYSVQGLTAITTDKKASVSAALKELETYGYLQRKRKTDSKGCFVGYEYNIYEEPFPDFPSSGFPLTENQPQLNTNIIKYLNNQVLNNKKKNIKKKTDSGYDDILKNIVDTSQRELYQEYIKMRKLIKAPMTERALQMLINKVNDLEPNSIERQKKLLETAIVNNWKSVYPLKNEPQTQGTVEEAARKYQSSW